MVKVSRRKLSPKKRGQLVDQLWKSITLLDNKKEVGEFLFDILTRTEIQMLSKRLETVKMLEEGYSYEAIRKELSVTDSTIAKMHNWYEAFGSGYKKVIARLHRIEREQYKGQPLVRKRALTKKEQGKE